MLGLPQGVRARLFALEALQVGVDVVVGGLAELLERE